MGNGQGYSAEEATGKNPRILKSGETPPEVYKDLWGTILRGDDWQGILQNRKKDGEIYWESATISPVLSSEGVVTHFVAVKEDVTDRRRAEKDRDLFRALLDRSNDAIEVIDAETGRFLDVNERACLQLGYSREEHLSLTVPDVDPGVDASTFENALGQLRESGSMVWEGVHRRKDGSTFPVEVDLAYVELHRPYLVSVVRDITERKQAEQDVARRVADLSALNAMAAIVNQSLGVDEILDRAMDEVLRETGVEAAAMYLLDEGPDELVLVSHRGVHDEFAQTVSRIKVGEGLGGRAAQSGEPAVIGNIRDYPGALPAYIEKERIQSAASVPLVGRAGVLGVMSVGTATPAHFDAAGVELLVGLGRQIATGVEKARLYETTLQSEKRFRVLAENTSVWVWEVDQNAAYTYASPKIKELLGYEPEEVLGKTPFELMPPDEAERVAAVFGPIVEARRPFEALENTNLHKDGRRIVMETGGVPIFDLNGDYRGYRGIDRDISERKHAAEALRKSEALTTVTSRLGEIFLTAAEDDAYHEVLKVVLAAMESEHGVFGYLDDRGDLVVPSMIQHIWEHCQVEDKRTVFPREAWGDSSWPRAIREKRVICSNEPSAVTPEGHVAIRRHVSQPILHLEEVVGLFQVANREADYDEELLERLDAIATYVAPVLVTRLERQRQQQARHRAEEEKAGLIEQLRRAGETLEQRVAERTSELRAANEELESFAYSVSHDLRAPLRSMGGFSKVLLERHAERLDTKGRHYLERIRAGAATMEQLVDGILELSRISRSELQREEIDLADLARELVASFRRAEPDRQVDFVIPDRLPASGDRHLLGSVLQNLLGNAWKFTAKEAGARIELGLTEQQQYFVRDNGAGFDAAYADKLFGAFQRLHSSAEFEGIGIGLATVRRIVRRHGGDIRAEGVVGEGATFTFTLEPASSDKKGA